MEKIYIEIPILLKNTSKTIGYTYLLFESDDLGFGIYLTKEKTPEDKSLLMYSSWKIYPKMKEQTDLQNVAETMIDKVVKLHFASL